MGETLKPITAKDHDLPKLRRANEPEPTSAESDKMTDEEYVKAMTGLKEVWEQQLSPVSLSQAEKIERDILDELSTLRQKVLDMETAKAFQVSIFDNLTERLGKAEDSLQKTGKLLERILELQEMHGRGGRS